MFGLSRLRAIEIGVALLLTLAALLFVAFRTWAEERGLRLNEAWAKPVAGQSTAGCFETPASVRAQDPAHAVY